MKFPRTTRILKGQLDAVPFLCVLFPLAFFLLFQHLLVLPAGTLMELPAGGPEPALAPGDVTLTVALDAQGRVYFENQIASDAVLAARLPELVRGRQPLPVLVVYADRQVPYARLAAVGGIARRAGLPRVLLAARPGP